ncbi:cyclase family protein [Nocardia caishijiensis]|uniref:Kynurenine formamidase n=1 Tax=Nocardia caishijiensis TaxID=184756 RepID=A0ABQ6YMT8_9NOCA|nr:cyclase family protein [Nocardia caishijiensis]KAF0847095.1 kynurenine formamidase [Nocardia caishijiensis]
MRLIDLTRPIHTGMPVFPGDPEVLLEPALRTATDGVNVLRVHLGSQSGTHVDAPAHLDDNLPTLDRLPLERFVGPARVVDARSVPARTAIGPTLFDVDLPPDTIVLIATGWSSRWGGPDYFAHPHLHLEAARLLVDKGIRTVGIDAPSIDPSGSDDPTLPAHGILCRAHAVIAENLTSLDELLDAQAAREPIEVALLPLPLCGADGAPIRAVARIGGR